MATVAERPPTLGNVYKTFRRWNAQGRFEAMHDRLRQMWRAREERDVMPSAAILDAQRTHGSPQGGLSGYDAGKKVKGRKRNLVVDTLGLLLAVSVCAANLQDRDAGTDAVARAVDKYPTVQRRQPLLFDPDSQPIFWRHRLLFCLF